MGRGTIVLLIMITFVLPITTGKNSVAEEKITINVTPWPGSSSFYIAHEKGYFREEGLDLSIQSYISGHLGLAALLSGTGDLATAGETPIARAVLDGNQTAIIATLCKINQAIKVVARKDKGVFAPEDLGGKRIGVVAGTTADFFLHIYLTISHIRSTDVLIVPVTPEKMVEDLLSGRIDALSTWAPHTEVLRDKLSDNAVLLYDPSLYTMTWNLVSTPHFLKNNPELVKKVLRALIRASDYIRAEPDKARAISSKYFGTDSLLFEREWANYQFNIVLDQGLILNLEDQARWMVRKEDPRPSKIPNFMHYIHTEGLEGVKSEAVRIFGR